MISDHDQYCSSYRSSNINKTKTKSILRRMNTVSCRFIAQTNTQTGKTQPSQCLLAIVQFAVIVTLNNQWDIRFSFVCCQGILFANSFTVALKCCANIYSCMLMVPEGLFFNA